MIVRPLMQKAVAKKKTELGEENAVCNSEAIGE